MHDQTIGHRRRDELNKEAKTEILSLVEGEQAAELAEFLEDFDVLVDIRYLANLFR